MAARLKNPRDLGNYMKLYVLCVCFYVLFLAFIGPGRLFPDWLVQASLANC